MSSSGSGQERRGPGRPPNRSGVTKSHGYSSKSQREKGQQRLQHSRGLKLSIISFSKQL